jgi:uncharacterized PurR-regulated membrane protein YhhQ (DUF165 family)
VDATLLAAATAVSPRASLGRGGRDFRLYLCRASPEGTVRTLLYVLSIVVVNAAFVVFPPISPPWGGVFSFATLFVGATFILRDFAQQEIGGKVWLASLAGALITAAFNPRLAVVSGGAFFAAELADQLVFTKVRGSFRARVLWSQLAGVALDTGAFLAGIALALGIPWSWASYVTMSAGKLAALSYLALARRRNARPSADAIA